MMKVVDEERGYDQWCEMQRCQEDRGRQDSCWRLVEEANILYRGHVHTYSGRITVLTLSQTRFGSTPDEEINLACTTTT